MTAAAGAVVEEVTSEDPRNECPWQIQHADQRQRLHCCIIATGAFSNEDRQLMIVLLSVSTTFPVLDDTWW